MRIDKILSVFAVILSMGLSGCQKNGIQITKSIAEEIALDDMNIKSIDARNLESKASDDGFIVSYTYKDMDLNYLINNNGSIEHSSMKRNLDFDEEKINSKDDNEVEKEDLEDSKLSISKNEAINSVLNYIGITEGLAEDLKVKQEEGYYEVSLTYLGIPYLLYVDGSEGSLSELPLKK